MCRAMFDVVVEQDVCLVHLQRAVCALLPFFLVQLCDCQFHIWLSFDMRGLLVYFGISYSLNFIISTVVFFTISYCFHQLTQNLVFALSEV